jgi:hypothetical protein
MARFKDFDAALAERTNDPITFALGDRTWTAEHVDAETFLLFVRKASNGGDDLLLAFAEFIDTALPEDEVKEFHEMLRRRDVPLALVMEVAKWIIETAAGNPTGAVSSSVERPSRRGQRPRVVSLSGGSTSKGRHSAAG